LAAEQRGIEEQRKREEAEPPHAVELERQNREEEAAEKQRRNQDAAEASRRFAAEQKRIEEQRKREEAERRERAVSEAE